jgi:hypothetical protein
LFIALAAVIVVLGAVLAVVLTRGGHSSTSSSTSGSISLNPGGSTSSTPPAASSGGLRAPQRIGDFVLNTSNSVPDSPGFYAGYTRASDAKDVFLLACRSCANGISPERLIQNKSSSFAPPSITTVASGGVNYVCISGPPSAATNSSTREEVCAWQAGSVLFELGVFPPLGQHDLIELARQAQADTGS